MSPQLLQPAVETIVGAGVDLAVAENLAVLDIIIIFKKTQI